MNRTQEYYELAKGLRAGMRKIQSDKAERLEALQKYKGSAGYTEETKKVEKEADEARKALQDDYRARFAEVLGRMHDQLDKVTVTAPTDEELRILQVLRMREELTAEELTAAARSVKSELCFPVLEELKRHHNIFGVSLPTSGKMAPSEAARVIRDLNKSAQTLCDMPAVDARSLFLKNPRYDSGALQDGRGTEYFALDRDFEDEVECLRGCAGAMTSVQAFKAIVNS